MEITTRSQKYGFTFTYLKDDSYVGAQMAVDNCEPSESALFYRCVQPDSVILDLGANIGYYTMLAGLKLRQGGMVVAVEPQSENFELLRKNVVANELEDVTITLRAAVSKEPGVAKLFLCKRDGRVLNRGDHRLWRMSETELTEYEEVTVTTIDSLIADYCNAYSLPTIVKMDTQGSEHLILQGAKSLFGAGTPLVLFAEFSPTAYQFSGTDEEEYFNLLNEQFEYLYIIDDLTSSAVPLKSYSGIINYCKARAHTHANLYCVRGADTLKVPAGDKTIKI